MLRLLNRLSFLSILGLPSSLAAQFEISETSDAARLIPANASILVRAQSSQALDDFVRALAPLAGDPAASFHLQDALNSMRQDAGEDPTGGVVLDPALPLYLAITLDPASGPAVTLVAPVTNGKPIHFFDELVGGEETNVTLGKYTGVSSVTGYAASATPSAQVAALRPGLVSAHVDLKAILALYRPLIDMGLQQAEAAMDTMNGDEVPLDIQPLLELYLDGARTVLDSVEALDLALEHQGDQVAFELDFRAREGSKLDGWASGKGTDVSRLAGAIDPVSSIQALFTGSLIDYLEPLAGVLDAVLAVYPEPLRGDLHRILDAQTTLAALLEPGIAAGFDFGSEGVHGLYVLRSTHPAEFIAGLEALFTGLDHPGGLFHVGDAERLVLDDVEARVRPFRIDYSAFQRMFEDLGPGSAVPEPEAFAVFQQTMEALYGHDLRLALAAQGGFVALCVANDDSILRADLARLRAPAAPAPELVRLMDRIEPGALGFAYHLDFGQTMGQMLDAFRSILPGPALLFPKNQASLGFWGSIHGRTWTGGFAMSVQELIGFTQAVQGLEGK